MSDTILTQRGQTLALAITFYEDQQATPLDLTGATITVRECKPAILTSATLSITSAPAGTVTMSLTEAQADQLGDGRVNWFRLEAQYDGDNTVTPMIWINVQ